MKNKVNKAYRLIAAVVAMIFSMTTVAWSAPAMSVNSLIGPDGVNISNLTDLISIDADFGLITKRHYDSKSRGPVIVHILDAHGQYEAQKNTQKILNELLKDHQISDIYQEGAIGHLDMAKVKIMQTEKLNALLIEKLAEKSILGGSELFLNEHAKNVHVYGVENAALYEANLDAYRAVYQDLPIFEKQLLKVKNEISSQASKVMNEKLYSFFKEWMFFQDNQNQLVRHMDSLEKHSSEILDVTLSDSKNQVEWPQLVRYSKIKSLSAEVKEGLVADEQAAFIEALNINQVNTDYIEFLQNWKENSKVNSQAKLTLRKTLEKVNDQMNEGLNLKAYPNLAKAFASQILSQELSASDLISETEKMTKLLLSKLIESKKELFLIRTFQNYILLQKMMQLELSHDDYLLFQKYQESIESALLERVIGSEDSALRKTYDNALTFYKKAIEREATILNSVLENAKAKNQEAVVLVTGGFHAEGLQNLFKQENLSYIEVVPSISQLEDTKNYSDIMTMRTNPLAENSYVPTPRGTDTAGLVVYSNYLMDSQVRPAARAIMRNYTLRNELRISDDRDTDPVFVDEPQDLVADAKSNDKPSRSLLSIFFNPIQTISDYLISLAKPTARKRRAPSRQLLSENLEARQLLTVASPLQIDMTPNASDVSAQVGAPIAGEVASSSITSTDIDSYWRTYQQNNGAQYSSAGQGSVGRIAPIAPSAEGEAAVHAGHGEGLLHQTNGNYIITTGAGVRLTKADEVSQVRIMPRFELVEPAFEILNNTPMESRPNGNFSELVEGQEVILVNTLGGSFGGAHVTSEDTIADFLLINGDVVPLHVQEGLPNQHNGWRRFDISFTANDLNQDGTDTLKFLSIYGDQLLYQTHYVNATGDTWASLGSPGFHNAPNYVSFHSEQAISENDRIAVQVQTGLPHDAEVLKAYFNQAGNRFTVETSAGNATVEVPYSSALTNLTPADRTTLVENGAFGLDRVQKITIGSAERSRLTTSARPLAFKFDFDTTLGGDMPNPQDFSGVGFVINAGLLNGLDEIVTSVSPTQDTQMVNQVSLEFRNPVNPDGTGGRSVQVHFMNIAVGATNFLTTPMSTLTEAGLDITKSVEVFLLVKGQYNKGTIYWGVSPDKAAFPALGATQADVNLVSTDLIFGDPTLGEEVGSGFNLISNRESVVRKVAGDRAQFEVGSSIYGGVGLETRNQSFNVSDYGASIVVGLDAVEGTPNQINFEFQDAEDSDVLRLNVTLNPVEGKELFYTIPTQYLVDAGIAKFDIIIVTANKIPSDETLTVQMIVRDQAQGYEILDSVPSLSVSDVTDWHVGSQLVRIGSDVAVLGDTGIVRVTNFPSSNFGGGVRFLTPQFTAGQEAFVIQASSSSDSIVDVELQGFVDGKHKVATFQLQNLSETFKAYTFSFDVLATYGLAPENVSTLIILDRDYDGVTEGSVSVRLKPVVAAPVAEFDVVRDPAAGIDKILITEVGNRSNVINMIELPDHSLPEIGNNAFYEVGPHLIIDLEGEDKVLVYTFPARKSVAQPLKPMASIGAVAYNGASVLEDGSIRVVTNSNNFGRQVTIINPITGYVETIVENFPTVQASESTDLSQVTLVDSLPRYQFFNYSPGILGTIQTIRVGGNYSGVPFVSGSSEIVTVSQAGFDEGAFYGKYQANANKPIDLTNFETLTFAASTSNAEGILRFELIDLYNNKGSVIVEGLSSDEFHLFTVTTEDFASQGVDVSKLRGFALINVGMDAMDAVFVASPVQEEIVTFRNEDYFIRVIEDRIVVNPLREELGFQTVVQYNSREQNGMIAGDRITNIQPISVSPDGVALLKLQTKAGHIEILTITPKSASRALFARATSGGALFNPSGAKVVDLAEALVYDTKTAAVVFDHMLSLYEYFRGPNVGLEKDLKDRTAISENYIAYSTTREFTNVALNDNQINILSLNSKQSISSRIKPRDGESVTDIQLNRMQIIEDSNVLVVRTMNGRRIDIDLTTGKQTERDPEDVNSDGNITPMDALLIINALNRNGGSIPANHPAYDIRLDVDGKGYIVAMDALRVINYLNRRDANYMPEGETVVSAVAVTSVPSAPLSLSVEYGKGTVEKFREGAEGEAPLVLESVSQNKRIVTASNAGFAYEVRSPGAGSSVVSYFDIYRDANNDGVFADTELFESIVAETHNNRGEFIQATTGVDVSPNSQFLVFGQEVHSFWTGHDIERSTLVIRNLTDATNVPDRTLYEADNKNLSDAQTFTTIAFVEGSSNIVTVTYKDGHTEKHTLQDMSSNVIKNTAEAIEKLDLVRTRKDFLNWSETQNERWIGGRVGGKWQWYFILPNGELYAWAKASNKDILNNATLVASLTAADYKNLLGLKAPEVIVHTDAAEAVKALGLVRTGKDFLNWSEGQNERWVYGSGSQWYFILPSGEVYAWDNASGKDILKNAILVAKLTPADHENLFGLPSAGAKVATEYANYIDLKTAVENTGVRSAIQRLNLAGTPERANGQGGNGDFYMLKTDNQIITAIEEGVKTSGRPGSVSKTPSVRTVIKWITDLSANTTQLAYHPVTIITDQAIDTMELNTEGNLVVKYGDKKDVYNSKGQNIGTANTAIPSVVVSISDDLLDIFSNNPLEDLLASNSDRAELRKIAAPEIEVYFRNYGASFSSVVSVSQLADMNITAEEHRAIEAVYQILIAYVVPTASTPDQVDSVELRQLITERVKSLNALLQAEILTVDGVGTAILSTEGIQPEFFVAAIPYFMAMTSQNSGEMSTLILGGAADQTQAIKQQVFNSRNGLGVAQRNFAGKFIEFTQGHESLANVIARELSKKKADRGLAASVTSKEVSAIQNQVNRILGMIHDPKADGMSLEGLTAEEAVSRVEAYAVRTMMVVDLAAKLFMNAETIKEADHVRLVYEYFESRGIRVDMKDSGLFGVSLQSISQHLTQLRQALLAQQKSA